VHAKEFHTPGGCALECRHLLVLFVNRHPIRLRHGEQFAGTFPHSGFLVTLQLLPLRQCQVLHSQDARFNPVQQQDDAIGAGQGGAPTPPSFAAMNTTIETVRSDAGHLFYAIETTNPFAADSRERTLVCRRLIPPSASSPLQCIATGDLSRDETGQSFACACRRAAPSRNPLAKRCSDPYKPSNE